MFWQPSIPSRTSLLPQIIHKSGNTCSRRHLASCKMCHGTFSMMYINVLLGLYIKQSTYECHKSTSTITESNHHNCVVLTWLYDRIFNGSPPSKSFHSVFLLVGMEMRRMFVTRALYALYVTSSHDFTDRKEPGSRLNTCIKTVFPMYGDSHVKDKTVLYLTWGSLYWLDDIFILRRSPDCSVFRKLYLVCK